MLQVHFTSSVVVRPEANSTESWPSTNATLWPRLWLELSGRRSDGYATYLGGSGSPILRFLFHVAADDFTADLDYTASHVALVGGSILRDTDTPSTEVNRSLPLNGAPGSLGHEANIVIDTTPPRVVAVLSALPAAHYGLRSALQTVELSWANTTTRSDRVLWSGEFRLAYGSSVTRCIAVNASAEDVRGALAALGPRRAGLFPNATVVSAEAPSDGNRRFLVMLGADERHGVQPLKVLVEDSGCAQWRCGDSAGERGECGAPRGDVVEFRSNAFGAERHAQGGHVEVTLRFDAPVVVGADPAAPPTLGLNLLPAAEFNASRTAYRPNATYAPGGLVQTIDVGVFASEPVVAGQFRLRYGGTGGEVTGCIGFEAASSAYQAASLDHAQELAVGGERNLRVQLEDLAPVAAIGLVSVSAAPLGNGTRFRVRFTPGSDPARLEPLPLEPGDCQPFVPADANVTLPPSTDVTFRYRLKNGDVGFPALAVAAWVTAPAISLGQGSSYIRRKATVPTTDVVLTLPTATITPTPDTDGGAIPHTAPALGGGSLVVDCSRSPRVVNVTTATWADQFGVNEWVDFYVTFDGPVVGAPGSALHLAAGNPLVDTVAVLVAHEETRLPVPGFVAIEAGQHGNGTKTLRFHYRVQEGDATPNLTPRCAFALEGEVTSAKFSQFVLASTDLRWAYVNTSNFTSDGSAAWDQTVARVTVTERNYTVDGGALALDTVAPHVVALTVDKANGTYTVGEEIFLWVHFSRPVAVAGTAVLRLNSGGRATLVRNAGNRQVFDVGADAAGPLQHFCCGKFRLGYGPNVTRCMQWDNGKAVQRGVHTLPGLADAHDGPLNPWPAPFKISGQDWHGGYRWTLDFPNGGVGDRPYPHALVPINAGDLIVGADGEDEDDVNGGCTPLAPPFDGSAVVAIAETHMLAFRYVVQAGDASTGPLGADGPDALELAPLPPAERLTPHELRAEAAGPGCLNPPSLNHSTHVAEAYVRRAANVRPLQDAVLTIPADALNGTNGHEVRVNGSAPRVVEVVCVSGSGPFTQGDVLDFRVRFDRPVWIVDLKTGADVESGVVVAEGNSKAPSAGKGSAATFGGASAEAECEGLAGTLDVLSLALKTVRTEFAYGEGTTSLGANATNATNATAPPEEDAVARARYVNGSGTAFLDFKYMVRPMEATDGVLEYANGTSLQAEVGFGVLARTTFPTMGADLRLPRPGTRGSLSFDQNVTIFASGRPATAVVQVTADVPEGCYDPGKLIHIHVLFSRCVQTLHGGALSLELVTGAAPTVLHAQPDARGRAFARMLVFPWTVGNDEHTLRVVTRPSGLALATGSFCPFATCVSVCKPMAILGPRSGSVARCVLQAFYGTRTDCG